RKASPPIELVGAVERADVLLVQFEDFEQRRFDARPVGEANPADKIRMDPAPPQPTFQVVARSAVRGYVLRRDGDVYTIIQAYRSRVDLTDRRLELRRAFEGLLRSRG